MSIFAEIAVDSYQDPTKRLFTYRVPENLRNSVKEGVLVTIPFGNRFVDGFVWSTSKAKPPFPTKPIRTIQGPAFSKPQIQLAKWMAERYWASPRDCLRCQIGEKGAKITTAPPDKIATLILVPYASQVKLRAATLRVGNGNQGVMIGSRSAVFAQLPNLKKIVIEEPENWSYKDERAPYYHAAEVAQKRAKIEDLELEMRSQIPRVEDIYFREKEIATERERGQHAKKLNPPAQSEARPWRPGLNFQTLKVRVIDLNREKLAGNFTFVSAPMETALSSAKYSLVYVSSTELRKGIEEELRKLGLDKNFYKVVGPDLFALPGQEAFHTIWADTDTLLNLPDFRAHEKIVWTVQKLNQITQGKLFLQTSSPENPLFKELESGPFDVAQGHPERSRMGGKLDSFYRRELENRRNFSFPPFAALVKLSYKAKSSVKVRLEAEKLYKQLTANRKRLTAIEVSPPYEPYTKKPGKVQLNLAVKIKPGGVAALTKLSKIIPPDWRVEVDPESLL